MSESSPNTDWRVPLARWLAPALLGVVAFALVLEITDPPNPGIDPDALAYVGSAESFALHGQFRIPTAHWDSQDSTSALSHFPPGFPTAMAVPLRLGMGPVQSARLVSATAAFVMVTTLAFLVAEATTLLAGILLATAFFAMSAMHVVHLSVLSEPLFLALLALTLAAMVRREEQPWLAGLWAALAAMTRYAGISAVGAVALWSMARKGTIADRLRRGAWALLPAVVLQGVWFVRTKLVASASSIRELALYGNLGKSMKEGATTLASWLVPDADGALDPADAMPHRGAIAAVAGALLVMIVLAGTLRALRQSRAASVAGGESDAKPALRLLAASALLIACYLALLIVSRVIADPGIPFDERILSPVIVLAMTIAATGIALWWRSTRAELPKIALCGALLGWWFGAASFMWVNASYVMAWGSDFAGDQWQRSELLAWARAHGRGHLLYSNWPVVAYFYLDRPARDVPRLNEADQLSAFADSLRAHDGRVLAFDVAGMEYETVDSLAKTPGLRMIARLHDGAVFAPAPVGATPALPPTGAPSSPPR
ncbi:MAG TPA: hypothetical protein VF461_12530 [Gemmatimonadaceae bacterium]